MKSTRHRLVVGIDFGTTYTGVSYGWSKFVDDSDIFRVESWPAKESKTEHAFKVPTQIAYAPSSETKYWGYQIESGVPRSALMKLLLDKDTRLSPHDDPGLWDDINKVVQNLPAGKDVQRVTTDFFTQLYNHTMDELQNKYPPEIIHLTPIDYWFTMPAIWSDEAQVRTLLAAEEAGFIKRAKKDQAFVITEPEAAALATVNSKSRVFGDRLRVGERVLICDCGGGTVDLTSYLVKKDDPWELAECYPGEGGKCGGTYLDRNLHNLLSDRFQDAFTSLSHDKTGQGSKFMDDFEKNKRKFANRDEELTPLRLYLDLPPSRSDHQYYDEHEGLVILTKQDMVTIFKPVVDEIIKLVSNQVKRTETQGGSVDYLMLVGGLGHSPYLRDELRNWCHRRDIKLGSHEQSWGIVAHGAVVRGLELATVKTRKCRRHYGVVIHQTFRQGVDAPDTAFYCRFTKEWRAPNYMSWSIHRGEDVEGDKPRSIALFQVVKENQPQITVSLKSSNEDEAPEKYDPNIVEDMKPIVTPVSDIELSEPMLDENGQREYRFDFTLDVILGHQRGTIAFRVMAKGKVVGQASLDLS